MLADAHELEQRWKDAIGEWRMALHLAPGDAKLESGLARSLWRAREYETARPLLVRLTAQRPASAELQYELGDLLFAQREIEKALPYLRRAAQLQPGLLPARAVLGRVLLQLGQAGEAIPHLEAALPVDGADGALHYQLGLAYREIGRPERARELFEQHRSMLEKQSRRAESDAEIVGPQ